MTKRYYLKNPYLTELKANIVHRFKKNNYYFISLDQTIFYPDLSGGQPFENGTINDIPLVKTIEEDGKLYHILKTDISIQHVYLKLNWKERFDHMQQHSGQHILSYCLAQLYNFNTINFKTNAIDGTIDLDCLDITDKQLQKAESLCQEIICNNIPIKCYTINKKKAIHLDIINTPKLLDQVRVVEIEDLDIRPCCGTHVSTTGEISMLKILNSEKINGKIRLHFLCGHRAFSAFQKQSNTLNKLFEITSSNINNIKEKLINSQERYKNISDQLNFYEKNEINYQTYFLKQKSQSFDSIYLISQIFDNYDPNLLKQIANNIVQSGPYVVVLGLNSKDECTIILNKSKQISDLHMNEILIQIKDLIGGKGGGSEYFAHLTGSKIKKLDEAMSIASQGIASQLNKINKNK